MFEGDIHSAGDDNACLVRGAFESIGAGAAAYNTFAFQPAPTPDLNNRIFTCTILQPELMDRLRSALAAVGLQVLDADQHWYVNTRGERATLDARTWLSDTYGICVKDEFIAVRAAHSSYLKP